MILNILNNPIRIIGGFTIKFLLKSFGVSNRAFPFFNVLYQTATALSFSVGILPTLRVIYHIGRHLTSTFTTISGLLTSNTTLNQYVVTTVLNAIRPFWSNLNINTQFIKFFSLWYKLLGFSLAFTSFRFMFRLTSTILFATVGILWNDVLSNIYYLKKFAETVAELLSYYLHIHIPLPDLGKPKKYITVVYDWVRGIRK